MSWPQVGHLICAKHYSGIDFVSDRIRSGKLKTGSFKISQTSTATCWLRVDSTLQFYHRGCDESVLNSVPHLCAKAALHAIEKVMPSTAVLEYHPVVLVSLPKSQSLPGCPSTKFKYPAGRSSERVVEVFCSASWASAQTTPLMTRLYSSQLRMGAANAICLP